nr:IS256 family transposase [Flaviflexus massiliensis]
MALNQSALIELLKELELTETTERIRLLTERAFQELINAEATAVIGAGRYERSNDWATQRNGTRPRTLSTTAGDLELRISKLRQGSFFPSLLERHRRVDKALFAVVMEAYVHGVSTRKVDDLVRALGADSGISKSEVSRICQDLDQDVAEFQGRSLSDTTYPYVFVDATYCKARVGARVVSQAIVIAIGIAADGRRQVLGFQVGDTESEPFWTEFCRDLKARGLSGVQLVISDSHAGLVRAIQVAFQSAAWQRCRVHFMRNVLARVPKVASQMVAAIIRTIFVPRGKRELVHAQFTDVVAMLAKSHPTVARIRDEAKDDLGCTKDVGQSLIRENQRYGFNIEA